MKKILYSLLTLSTILAAASCAKEVDPYKPAPVPTGDQVYFHKDQPTEVNVKNIPATKVGEETSKYKEYNINVYRVNTSDDLSVLLDVRAIGKPEDLGFIVPSTVTFLKESNIAAIKVKVDTTILLEGCEASLGISIADEELVTPYGKSEVSINFKNPEIILWQKFDKGTLTEKLWDEEEPNKEMLYMDYRTVIFSDESVHHIKKCKIESCFGYETIKKGKTYDVQDYVWYWDTDTDNCYIVPFYIGYPYPGYGNVYATDMFGQTNLIKDFCEFLSDEYFEKAPQWLEENGYQIPSYDGNGKFSLANTYIILAETALYTWQQDGDPDYFIGGSFTRTTDYNNDYDYKTIGVGVDSSLVWNGEVFDTKLASIGLSESEYDTEAVDSAYVMYLPDYFTEGKGLAFILNEVRSETDTTFTIADAANVQHSGVTIFGKEVGVSINGRKSKVVGTPGTYPYGFELQVKVDLYDEVVDEATGKSSYVKAVEMGEFIDYITITKAAWYSADDIYEIPKQYYLGDFNLYANNAKDDERYTWPISVSDAGTIGEASYISVKGMLPYNSSLIPENETLIEWYDGLLYMEAMEQPGDSLTYAGNKYPVTIYHLSSETGYVYEGGYLIAGYNEDDNVIAFTNYPYNSVNIDGIYAEADMEEGGLCAFYQIQWNWPEEESTVAKAKDFVPAKWQIRTLPEVKALSARSQKMHKALNLPSIACPYIETKAAQAVQPRELNTSCMKEVSKKLPEVKQFVR